MTSADLLADAFGRIREDVHAAVAGLPVDALHTRLDEGTNSIAWLVWHLTRVQDDHVAGVAGHQQVWTAQRWHDRFGLARPVDATGYGDNDTQVDEVRVTSAELLTGYHDAVYEQTLADLRDITDADLARVVDQAWNPPVTLGVRLVSVIDDDMQHAGQAALLRGVLLRR